MSQSKPQQLSFVFADSPQGGGQTQGADASVFEAQPLHTTHDSQRKESTPRADADEHLLELVCDQGNLRRALAKASWGARPEEPDV